MEPIAWVEAEICSPNTEMWVEWAIFTCVILKSNIENLFEYDKLKQNMKFCYETVLFTTQ